MKDLKKYFNMALDYNLYEDDELLELEGLSRAHENEKYAKLAEDIAERAVKLEALLPDAKEYMVNRLGRSTVDRLYELYGKINAERVIYDTYIEALEELK